MVPTYTVNSKEEAMKRYDEFMAEGYEGAILRFMDAEYVHDRVDTLLKVKDTQEAEFELLKVVAGNGNRSGMAGAAWVRLPNGGSCKINLKGGYKFYKDLWLNRDKYIGKKITVLYQGFTPDGDLRFGRGKPLKAIRDYE